MKFNFALICFWIFTSCTQQRIAFRFADTAASWKADDYFDLTSQQKDEVKKHLKIFLKNVYENNDREIVKIFDHADEILAKVNDQSKVDCGELEKVRIQTGTVLLNIFKIGANDIQILTQTLNKQQIQYFTDQVTKKIKDDELKNQSEREDRRLKRNLDNSKVFLGALTAEQQKNIATHVTENPFPFKEQLKNNKLNFEKLKTLNTTPELFRKFILDYLMNWRSYQSTEYIKQSDSLRLKNELFYQKLVCEASVKQLKHLRYKLTDIKKDFEEFFIVNSDLRIEK